MSFTKSVQQQWFELIQLGLKTIEGRRGTVAQWEQYVGKVGAFTCSDGQVIHVRITGIRHYTTLDAYLAECWKHAAPQCASVEAAKQDYLLIRDANGETVFDDASVAEKGGIVALNVAVV